MGLGLHGGGVGTAQFFARLGSRVVVTDLKTKRELAPSIATLRRFKNVTYHLGGHTPADFRTVDYVIQNPGVPGNSKYLRIAGRSGVSILSDAEIFFLTCPAPIIGVTGTKGKSTATWLLGEFLKKGLKKRIWIGGNIRKSMLEFLPRVEKNDFVVLELSSFQLDMLRRSRRSPHLALITNIFPDHLNRYPSMRSYIASKAAIFKFQRPKDSLFINARDPLLVRIARSAGSRVVRFDPETTIARHRAALASGIPRYHLPNIAGAIAIAQHLGVGEKAIRQVLKRFRGMSGRMELIRVIHGIEFINDTTATNPTAAREGVRATKRRIGNRSLRVIAGGYDKGLAVKDFVNALARCATSVVLLPGTAARKMESRIRNQESWKPNVYHAHSMSEAVNIAYAQAKGGDVVLLSPGAASFGLFQHEFDRGEQFARAVQDLT